MREQATGPAHAALHFVVNDEHARLAAHVLETEQPFGRQRPCAAFALHRLDQNGRRRRRRNRGNERRFVIEIDLDIARQARTETIEIGGIARCIDRRIRPAVERSGKADHVDAVPSPRAA
jgi:hypothetical protein